jgi:hypothetical protein
MRYFFICVFYKLAVNCVEGVFKIWGPGHGSDLSEVKQRVTECIKNTDASLFWSCLTYETKKDFHKEHPEIFNPDGTMREAKEE